MILTDPAVMEREVTALIFELHLLGYDCTSFAWRLEECVKAGNLIGLRDLQNEIIDQLDILGWP